MRLIDRHRLLRAAAPVAVGICLARPFMTPGAADAQTLLGFRPSLTVTYTHDSNLFFAPFAPQADFVTRVTPAIESEYRSPLWTWSGRYALSAEHFAEHAELSRADAGQHALAGFRYRPSERTVLATSGGFSRTQTPGELIPETGLGFARGSAQRLEARSSITRRLSPLTTGAVDYAFTEDRVAAGAAVRTHGATIASDRRVSARDMLNAEYRFRQFIFGSTASASHALNLEWTRSITGRGTVSIAAGPNVTDAATGLDVAASLRNRFRAGDVTLGYARTQTTVFGLADVVQVQSVSAAATWNLGRSLQLHFAPAVYQTRRDPQRADVFRLMAGAVCPLSRTLSVEVSVDASRQRGALLAGFGNEVIPRYQAAIKLVAAPGRHPKVM